MVEYIYRAHLNNFYIFKLDNLLLRIIQKTKTIVIFYYVIEVA